SRGSFGCAYGPRIFEQANNVISLPSRLSKSRWRSCRTRSARAGTASELAHSEAESSPGGAFPQSSQSKRLYTGPDTLAKFRSAWAGIHRGTGVSKSPEQAPRTGSVTSSWVLVSVAGVAPRLVL